MEAVILTILFFVLAGVGASVLWFSRDQQGKRRLKRLESIPIAEATDGTLVKVTGTLALADVPALEAPLTARSCAGYVIEVKERANSGANSSWMTIIMKEDAVAFVVEDASGKALVRAAGAHLVLVRDGHLRSGSLGDHSERAHAFLTENGTPSETILRTKKTVRYDEGVLEPGEEVSILGVGRWEPIPASMRTEAQGDDAKWLTFESTSEHPITISDDPSTL